ncbi:M48 family metalloprotease [Anaeromyxobacter sp. PSR-1]|uniref:M48 family metalloprotease n=1 Tax=unclassified Anaeromyxobacter TaxID=2620896 RepID=UPI0005DECACE|nr:M48 family metalloprotease [Anaeromyxobacter sp. PSR-1]GAO01393.1 hypothetical protein PSR1_00247 [Anaeromyxobacter sp. PSR-1]
MTALRSPPALDPESVRHPRERLVFWLSVLVNAAVGAAAIWLVYRAPGWLTGRPALSRLANELRVAGVATLALIPALAWLRHARWAEFREGSLQLGPDQLPAIHAMLERLCAAVGAPVPELFSSTSRSAGIATAMGLVRRRRIIVLGPDLFRGLKSLDDRADIIEFVLAHELGRLVMGHASWREELLLAYLKRIPLLRVPLLNVQEASRDRLAARLCPGTVRAMLFTASGGKLIYSADVAAFLRQALRDDTPPFWEWASSITGDGPDVGRRLRHLHAHGFVDLDAELERLGARPGPAVTPAGPAAEHRPAR